MAPTSPHATGFNGAYVKQIRGEIAAAGKSEGQFAEEIGMSPTVLSRYLNFQRALTLPVAERLANGLGLTYMTLMQRAWSEREGQ